MATSETIKMDAVLFSQCGHFVPMRNLKQGGLFQWKAQYDYCPDCKRIIEEKQDELQTTFSEVFDGSKEGS